jgi:hypothetical protein
VETIDRAAREGEATAETFGLEALALSDEGNAPGWEEDGLFVPLDDYTSDTPSLGSIEQQIKREESEAQDSAQTITERLPLVLNEAEGEGEGVNVVKQQTEVFSSDVGSTSEYTPDTSDGDEPPRISVPPRHRQGPGHTSATPADFLHRQADTYKKIFQDAFAATCQCKFSASIYQNIHA